jgi:hypothetical protein
MAKKDRRTQRASNDAKPTGQIHNPRERIQRWHGSSKGMWFEAPPVAAQAATRAS